MKGRTMARIRTYEGTKIEVRFDLGKCIHARECVLGLPAVFKENERKWIDPEGADPNSIAATIRACPSGALTYERKDNGDEESAPPVNRIRLWEHGPLEIRGEVTIAGDEQCNRAVLCRCGASKNKPYCDNSHLQIAFKATSEPRSAEAGADEGEAGAEAKDETLAPIPQGPVRVEVTKNGPMHVTGSLEIIAGSGRQIQCADDFWLCRCGASANKPFCDGSHKKIGFTAPASE